MPIKTTTLLLSLCLIPAAAMAAPADAPPRPASARAGAAGLPVVAQAQPRPSGAAAVQRFARGDVLPEAYRTRAVKNPYHYGLTPPRRDQQWVQVGRSFYLIDRTSGRIADRVDV